MRPWIVRSLACAWLAATGVARCTPPPTAPPISIQDAEAAPADWLSQAPPKDGWTPVKLMDLWDTRWPHHDGVVWYRLHWNQASAETPSGLLVDYVNSAYAVYVNGSLIYRDTHLVEPLSRSWIQPQYFLLDKPLLRQGENTLVVRVSGIAAYQPGLGTVTVGDPARVKALYRAGEFWRHDVQLFDQSVSLVFGGLFFILWLLRRKDAFYGWYALNTLCWWLYSLNFIVSSPWPFGNTDAWEAFNAACYVAAAAAFAIFLLRYVDRRWPRFERCLLGLCAALLVVALLFPRWAGVHRDATVIFGTVTYYAAMLGFIGYALRHPRADCLALAGSLLISLVVSLHDLLLFFGVIHSDSYLLAATSPLTIIGMGFALAYRFAAAMRRAENFNIELQREVQAATRQLAETLQREHDLALNHARVGERLHLVRDLHDGFGGSLLAAIATLENPGHRPEPHDVVATLKELRDDLRLVIDTTTHEQDTDIAALIAPLRHRWHQRLEAAAIDSRWTLDGVDSLRLGAARALELLRFLQEALTNVLKHSNASLVHISIRHDAGRLSVDVRDDGRGFDPANEIARGAGLPSLHLRAARLGATLRVTSSPGSGTTLSFDAAGVACQPG